MASAPRTHRFYTRTFVELFFARLHARVRMGTLFWRPIGICTRFHGQMDHLTHSLESMADEEIRKQIRVAGTDREWDVHVLYREEEVNK